MSFVSRIFALTLIALWLLGCATEPATTASKPTRIAKAAKGKSKSTKRYLDIPLETSVGSRFRFPKGARNVDDALYAFAPSALEQIKPYFRKAGVSYPPNDIVLIAIKDEKSLSSGRGIPANTSSSETTISRQPAGCVARSCSRVIDRFLKGSITSQG